MFAECLTWDQGARAFPWAIAEETGVVWLVTPLEDLGELLSTDVWWSKQIAGTPGSREISAQALLSRSRFMTPTSKDRNTNLITPIT